MRNAIYGGCAALLGGMAWLTMDAWSAGQLIIPDVFFLLPFLVALVWQHLHVDDMQLSLMPLAAVTSILVMGPLLTGWAVLLLTAVYQFLLLIWKRPSRPLLGQAVRHAFVKTAVIITSVLVAGMGYVGLGGIVPIPSLQAETALPLFALSVGFIATRRLSATLAKHLDTLPPQPNESARQMLLIAYELGMLTFAPMLALIYLYQDRVVFLIAMLGLVLMAWVTQNAADMRTRLEQRIQGQEALQQVGQALSASLDLDVVLSLIQQQVYRLIPATTFTIALYDTAAQQLSFPLVTKEGRQMERAPQALGNGLAAYVVQTKRPLLIRSRVVETAASLGVTVTETPIASWLGVPIMAGAHCLGVMSVQSEAEANVYKRDHMQMLQVIANQAAIAIQNAHKFEQTNEALQQRVQQLDSIMQTTEDGILLLDSHRRLLAVNQGMFALLQSADGEDARISAKPESADLLLARLSFTPESFVEACEETLKDGTRQKKIVFLDDAQERCCARMLAPVFDDAGAVTSWLIVLHDVTEEASLNQMRQEMTHMLMHDLRSPLSVLLGSLETARVWLDQGAHDALQQLFDLGQMSGARMLRLLNDLLDVYKLEGGDIPLLPEETSVEMMLLDAKLQLAPTAEELNISVEVAVSPLIPFIHVDVNYIGRAIVNVLDNALKYTPKNGRIRLWAEVEEQESTSFVRIGVSDNGPGIMPEFQHQIFKKFQHDPANRGRRRGTGLGLPFCKLVVEAHNGDLWVESSGIPGEGATFLMRLPVTTETEKAFA